MLSASSTFYLASSISRRTIGVNAVNGVAAHHHHQQQHQQQQRCKSTVGNSPSLRNEAPNPNGFYPVYIHNISKMVLEHLQENRSDWIFEKGLDRRLSINPNGTFTMSFPARKGFDSGRIWTSYDASQKKHWISVYRQKLAVRFLLKEYGPSAPKVHDSSVTERQIMGAVDQMISAIDQTESQKGRREA